MRRLIFILITFLVFIAGPSHGMTSQEILEIVDEIRAPAETFIFDTKAIVKKNEKESILAFTIRVKEKSKSLVIYKSPPSNKGRVLLMVGENMWIYIPGTRKPIRISPQQQIVGRVSNTDIARVVYGLDYSVEAMEDDVLEDKKVIKMVLAKKTRGAAYNSIYLWIQKDSFKPIKAEFFTISNRLLKTVYYRGYREVLGKERPMILEIHDAIDKSQVTILKYSHMKIEDTPDSWYQKTFMQRVR